MRVRKTNIVAAAVLPTILLAAGAGAVDYEAQVRAGAGLSDNLGRTPQDEIDEAMMTFGFDFSVSEQTNRLELDLQSSFDYIYYDSDLFEEEVIGGLNGAATFTLIDERLQWVVEDNYGQQLFDPLQPASPGNRENVNYFTTGPTLSLIPASRNSIILDAQYSRVSYEERPSDNDRLSGMLSVGREISRDQALTLNLTGNRLEYIDALLAPVVDRYAAYARYEATGNRNTLAIDLGYNEVEYLGTNSDGVLFRIDWARTMSANAILTISGGSEFSDQGDYFRRLQDTTPNLSDTADVIASNAPFLNNYLTIGYALDQTRYSIVASAGWNQEDYRSGTGEDRDFYTGVLRLRRDVSRKIFAGIDARLQRREFRALDRRDDDLTLGLEMGYRVTSGFDVSIEYRHFQRESGTIGGDITENRAFLLFAYTPVWSRHSQ